MLVFGDGRYLVIARADVAAYRQASVASYRRLRPEQGTQRSCES